MPGIHDGAPSHGSDADRAKDASHDVATDAADGATPKDGGPRSVPKPPPPGTLWPTPGSLRYHRVPVCFTTQAHLEWNGDPQCSAQTDGEHACSGHAFTGTTAGALRARLRALLEDTWQRVSLIEFREFSDCPEPTPSGYMRVTFTTSGSDPEPPTVAVTGVGMHSTYPADVHVDWRALRDGVPSDLRVVLREVGHALGLPYEWLSSTTAGIGCSGVTRDPAFGLVKPPAGLSDDDSVMNRCGDTERGAVLSPADIVGVQGVYGRKPPSSLIGYRGRCVEVRDRSLELGTPIIAAECTYVSYDWFRSNAVNQNSFYTDLGNGTWDRCFDAYGSVGTASTPITSNAWDGSPSEAFSTTKLQWTIASLCVAAIDATPPRLELQACDGSLAQQWNFWDNSGRLDWKQIQSAYSGDCVSIEALATDAGASTGAASGSVTLRPCALGGPAQMFGLNGAGGLYRTDTNAYIAIFGDRIAPGVPLTTVTNVSYRTSFIVTGSFKSLGQCLAILGGGDPLDLIGIEPCNPNSPTERFEFYW